MIREINVLFFKAWASEITTESDLEGQLSSSRMKMLDVGFYNCM